MSVLIFIGGIVLGWLVTTLIEWLWFRSKRGQMQDARLALGGATTGAGVEMAATSVNELATEVVEEVEAEIVEPFTELLEDAAGRPSVEASVSETVVAEPVVLESAIEEEVDSPVPAETAIAEELDPVSAQNQNYPDDLTRIKGIGKVYEQKLYQAGIATWHQIATATVAQLTAATEAIDAANVDEWQTQAAELAQSNEREGVVYSGPAPDPLTEIPGISDGIEQNLYKAGILTFGQLAATNPESLQVIMDNSGNNRNHDFAGWIEQAAGRA